MTGTLPKFFLIAGGGCLTNVPHLASASMSTWLLVASPCDPPLWGLCPVHALLAYGMSQLPVLQCSWSQSTKPWQPQHLLKGSLPGEPPERLLQEAAPCLTRFLPSILMQSTRVLSHMAAAFSPSTSSPFHAPSSPVFSLNNTSQSNQINHLLSTSSPGGLFGDCGTIFLSLYLLLKPSSGEQQFLSVQHYKQSIRGRVEEKEKPKLVQGLLLALSPHSSSLHTCMYPVSPELRIPETGLQS